MHPSLQHRYGLRSRSDVAIAERMVTSAKKAGWTDSQVDGFLKFYATLAPALERGQLGADQALHQLWSFAEIQGVGLQQREALLDWHTATGEFMAAHNGELPRLEKQSAEAAAVELAEIQRIQREDPDRYWRDEVLQSRLYDLLEVGNKAGVPPPVATQAHVDRLGELSRMMGDYNSPYWSGATGPALQAEYRNLLSLGAPGGQPATQTTSTGASASRRAEIERLMRDQGSAYWAGATAPALQAEYRNLVSLPAPGPESQASGSASAAGGGGADTQGSAG